MVSICYYSMFQWFIWLLVTTVGYIIFDKLLRRVTVVTIGYNSTLQWFPLCMFVCLCVFRTPPPPSPLPPPLYPLAYIKFQFSTGYESLTIHWLANISLPVLHLPRERSPLRGKSTRLDFLSGELFL